MTATDGAAVSRPRRRKALNDWWAGRPEERFWMEITDRPDMGRDLRAPQHNTDGDEPWFWKTLTYVRPGDIVLHWRTHRAGSPAVVGWSEVTGELYSDAADWQVRNPRTRLTTSLENLPHWIVPLGGMHKLPRPVDAALLSTRLDDVKEALDVSRLGIRGAVYPPLVFYGGHRLQAMEAYLGKLPAAFIPIVEELAGAEIGMPAPEDGGSATVAGSIQRRSSGSGRQGRQQDPVLRKLIEDYAVDRAKTYYFGIGASRIDPLGKPYDLKVQVGRHERHVEVKGTTTSEPRQVTLTVGEVRHVREWIRTDLFVVEGIEYEPVNDGYRLWGGSDHIWKDWSPDDRSLHPTEYSYDLPWDDEAEL